MDSMDRKIKRMKVFKLREDFKVDTFLPPLTKYLDNLDKLDMST